MNLSGVKKKQVPSIQPAAIKVQEFLDRIPSRPFRSNHAEDNHFEPHSSSPEHTAHDKP